VSRTSLEDALYHLLCDEIQKYRELVELTRFEQNALCQENLNDLSQAIKEKEQHLATILRCAEVRDQHTNEMLKVFGLTKKHSLSELLNSFDETSKEKFEILQQEFENLMEQFCILNHTNYLLIRCGLSFTEATIEQITSIMTASDESYTARGGSDSSKVEVNSLLSWVI
jgi:hypothetical protein